MRTVLVATVFLAGCGAEATTIGDQEARQVGHALAIGLEESAQLYGPIVSGAGIDAPCTPLSGDIDDSDLDTIPASATLTCTWPSMSHGHSGTLNGTIAVADDAPGASAWAFTGTADQHVTLAAAGAGRIVRDWDGTVVATQTTSFDQNRVLHAVSVFPAVDRFSETTVTEDSDWTITYVPRAAWSPGASVDSGTLTAVGTWEVETNHGEALASLETLTPLTIDPGCAMRIVDGRVAARYHDASGDHTFVVTWSDCATRTFTWTGSFAF